LDRGGGRPRVYVRCVEVTGPTLYHPLVPSDGGIRVPQLGAERLDLSLSSQQVGSQLRRHIQVVYHLHPGDILLHCKGLESALLLLMQEAVDGVLQLSLVATALRSDGLPGGVSHNITDRCSEGWPLVHAEDPRPREDLYNCLEFHPPWTWDSLDLVSWGGGDAQVSQQSMKPARGDCASAPKDSLSSASLYIFSPSLLLRREYSSSSSSSLSTSWYCYSCSSTGVP
jgi:hypothetical protein